MKKNGQAMSEDVVNALILLDKMRVRAEKYSNSFYQVERIEQAMDYIINNPVKQGDPKTIVRDVMGSAGTKIRNRINVIKEASTLAGVSSPVKMQQNVTNDVEHLTIEVIDEIERNELNSQTTDILVGLVTGKDAVELAIVYKCNVSAMRTRISKAKTTYRKKVGFAG